MIQDPILSIGMIVKNEIRCLERCLQALQPLRDALPCELVIADTGSTDGTREIAEHYADLVFDFPWVNDFSAARNAVMDRCSGQWYLSVDADEYLRPDIEELVRFLTSAEASTIERCTVVIRNYNDREMTGIYDDFPAMRMARMEQGPRYSGTIHEQLPVTEDTPWKSLRTVIFDHDGYAYATEQESKRKGERNLALLELELERDPEDVTRMLQCLESAFCSIDKQRLYARRSMELVMRGGTDAPDWRFSAPAIARKAVYYGLLDHMPETEEWINWAVSTFPNSPFVQVDVSAFQIQYLHAAKRYAEEIAAGKRYLKGVRRYRNGEYPADELLASVLQMAHELFEYDIRGMLGVALEAEGQRKEALSVLGKIDMTKAFGNALTMWFNTMEKLREEPAAVKQMARMLGGLLKEEKDDTAQKTARRVACLERVGNAFWVKQEEQEDAGRPEIWSLYRDVPGTIGLSVQLMDTQDSQGAERLLGRIEAWDELPNAATIHALELGAQLPDTFFQQSPEHLREFAVDWGTHAPDTLAKWLLDDTSAHVGDDWAGLSFLFDLAAACLSQRKISERNDVDVLIQRYVEIGKAYLSQCYHPALLADERAVGRLPGMHRFDWYLLRARAKQEMGDLTGYLHQLRAALKQAPSMKNIVKALMEQAGPEIQAAQQVSDELKALAERVRTILSTYPADHPAVLQIKASPVYQQVAHLLE